MKRRDGTETPNEMTQPARMESIPALVEFVSTHAWEGAFEDAKITEIRLAISEALENIVRFACSDSPCEITVKCGFHDTGALLVDIIDTGKHFNMLVAGVFPETADFVEPGEGPSLKKLKKTIKNLEYRRDGGKNKNILACIIPK